MNHEDIILNETIESQKDKYYVTPPTEGAQRSQMHEQSRMVVVRGIRRE